LGKQILNDYIGIENEDFGQTGYLGNILRFAKGNRLIRLGEYHSQFEAFSEYEWWHSKWLWRIPANSPQNTRFLPN
jgi:hypothetical protein